MTTDSKCPFCGMQHGLQLVYWGGIPIKLCPLIPNCLVLLALEDDQDEDAPLPTSF
jgi:hypothetical protein